MSEVYTQYLIDKYGVAWWKFDEESGNTIVDELGNYNGTAYNVTRVDGIDGGKALSFNGSNSYVQFNNPVLPLGAKSIRFKIKTNQSSLGVFFANASESGNHGIWAYIEYGKVFFASGKGTRGDFRFLIDSNIAVVNDGVWHDVLLTWDGTTNKNTVKLYVDDMNTPVNQMTAKEEELVAYSENLFIGRNTVGNSYFNGQLDEIEIYNKFIEPTANKIFLSSSDKKIKKVDSNNKLVTEYPSLTKQSLTEQDYLNYGMDVETPINPSEFYTQKKYVQTQSNVLGDGIMFETEIDMSKYDVKKIIIE